MFNPRHLLVGFLLGLLALSLLFGCRAWEPETVIVNRPPEIYIIGSPAETSGAYFHFRVFWYGTDQDGLVERYVWALTDTSIQDQQTDEDEEDQRFNPATNIGTLAIGNWTTRTDTVFDFRINQGAQTNYDMTLHMVAVDDRGDFSRKPARLHFFSNALGNPTIAFYRDEALSVPFANFDTVGYGRPLTLRWDGYSRNADPAFGYDPARLAVVDTVNPEGRDPDGLLGFKWRLPQVDDCNPSVEDCWRPRRFNEALGESLSFFGNLAGLDFRNDGSGSGFFDRRFEAGVLRLLVNTIDVAGVEVLPTDQVLNIVVNYAPRTRLLGRGLPPGQAGEQGPPEHGDTREYPYYEIFHYPPHLQDLAGTRYPFREGDTIPDRAYVVFKALGWEVVDDAGQPRDVLESDFAMTFQGEFVAGAQPIGGTTFFTFQPGRSVLHQTSTPEAPWTAQTATDVSSDTLGFQVGPFEYEMIMRSVDEQLTRGLPDTFRFSGNFPPCVQCIELAKVGAEPQIAYEDDCYLEACAETADLLVIRDPDDPQYEPGNDLHLTRTAAPCTIYVRPPSGIQFTEPLSPAGWEMIDGYAYQYLVFLHGKDDEREYWAPGKAHQRVAAWRYQVDYEGDVRNAIQDGGGQDNLQFMSGFPIADNQPNPALSDFYILNPFENTPGQFDYRGAWALRVTVGVPQLLLDEGVEAYWDWILDQTCGADPDCPDRPSPDDIPALLAWQQHPTVRRAYQIFELTTMQFTPGSVTAVASDQSQIRWRPLSNCYNYFTNTRMPGLVNPRQCSGLNPPEGFRRQGFMDLSLFAAESEPMTKEFAIQIFRPGEEDPIVGGQDPPGWVASKGIRGAWR